MRAIIKSIAIATAALAFTVVPTAGAHAATASPTYHCMEDCNGGGESGYGQQSYGDNSNDDSSNEAYGRGAPKWSKSPWGPKSPKSPKSPKYKYYVPGGGSYTGGRCDAPYGPSGPARGCPWN
jgi:hypothetical protein